MNRVQVGIRLGALAVVALLGFVFITADVLGYRLGAQGYPLTVELAKGGGLFPDAYVTYRGVDVGRVSDIELTRTGLITTLRIDPGVEIPSNAIAEVRDLSAAGEQYLDLIPQSASTDYFKAGAVIPVTRTKGAIAVSTLLNDASKFIGTINAQDVQVVSNALGSGFNNTGEDLKAIVDAAQTFITALQQAEPATATTITDAAPLLSAALSTNGDLAQFASSLQQITAQLASSNADIAGILGNGVPAEAAVGQLLSRDSSAIEALIGNLASFSNVAASRQPAVQALLAQLPAFTNRIAASVVNGSVQAQLYFNNANTVCPYILGAQTPEPTAPESGAPAQNRTCPTMSADMLQRGAANAPVASGG